MSTPSSPQRPSVSQDQTTTFPLESLTEEQRDVFERFITVRREDWRNIHEPIWFALVLTDERPATTISEFDTHPEIDLPDISVEEIATVFDLHCQRKSKIWHLAKTNWRFDLLPSSKESNGYHRRFGCFFGYPEPDIEYFITEDPSQHKFKEFVKYQSYEPEELAYTTFIPWQPEQTTEGCKRAIRFGKENRITISEYADAWDLNALNAYANWLYYDALTKFSL